MDKMNNEYFDNIIRLMNYDRSKTLFEQQSTNKPKDEVDTTNDVYKEPEASIEVGEPYTAMEQKIIYVDPYITPEEESGEAFGYPDYCRHPYQAIKPEGKRIIPGYCYYNTINGPMLFPKGSQANFWSDNRQDNYDMVLEYGSSTGEPLTVNSPAMNHVKWGDIPAFSFTFKTVDEFFTGMGDNLNKEFEQLLRNELYDYIIKNKQLNSDTVRTIVVNRSNEKFINLLTWDMSLNVYGSEKRPPAKNEFFDPFYCWWSFTDLAGRKSRAVYVPPKIVVRDPSAVDVWAHLTATQIKAAMAQIASWACGEDSLFVNMIGKEPDDKVGLFSAIGLDYTWDEFFCDILSGLLMLVNPPAALAVELLHAYDLYENKDDPFGAALSLSIGMIPLFGDMASGGLRSLVKTVGKNGFTKAIRTLSLFFKFLSGEAPATAIWKSFKKLTKQERQLVFDFYATGKELIKKTGDFSKHVDNALSNLTKYQETYYTKESLQAVKKIINGGGPLETLLNIGLQMGGIFTCIFGASVIKSLGFDPNDMSPEEFEKQFQALLEREEMTGGDLFAAIASSDDSLSPLPDANTIKISFEENYPCVSQHPDAKEITYNRRLYDNQYERMEQLAYDINGDIYFFDGLRVLKGQSDTNLTEYSCDSSVFSDIDSK